MRVKKYFSAERTRTSNYTVSTVNQRWQVWVLQNQREMQLLSSAMKHSLRGKKPFDRDVVVLETQILLHKVGAEA